MAATRPRVKRINGIPTVVDENGNPRQRPAPPQTGSAKALIIEAEAGGRACPMARAAGEGTHSPCAGQRCMAWRWADDTRGWCGMAGRPAGIDRLVAGSGDKVTVHMQFEEP